LVLIFLTKSELIARSVVHARHVLDLGQRSLIDQLVGRNIGVLSESYTVYAIDLLGFGASDKPAGFSYTMETWAEASVLSI